MWAALFVNGNTDSVAYDVCGGSGVPVQYLLKRCQDGDLLPIAKTELNLAPTSQFSNQANPKLT